MCVNLNTYWPKAWPIFENRNSEISMIVVRHARTISNHNGIFQGHADSKIVPDAANDLNGLSKILSHWNPDECFTSDLGRALQTAKFLGFNSPSITPLLRERAFGSWESKTAKQIAQEDPTGFNIFFNIGPADFAPPNGGESRLEVRSRMIEFLDLIKSRSNNHKKYLIVTHGGWTDALYRWIHDLPLNGKQIFDLQNSHVALIQLGKQCDLLSWDLSP